MSLEWLNSEPSNQSIKRLGTSNEGQATILSSATICSFQALHNWRTYISDAQQTADWRCCAAAGTRNVAQSSLSGITFVPHSTQGWRFASQCTDCWEGFDNVHTVQHRVDAPTCE